MRRRPNLLRRPISGSFMAPEAPKPRGSAATRPRWHLRYHDASISPCLLWWHFSMSAALSFLLSRLQQLGPRLGERRPLTTPTIVRPPHVPTAWAEPLHPDPGRPSIHPGLALVDFPILTHPLALGSHSAHHPGCFRSSETSGKGPCTNRVRPPSDCQRHPVSRFRRLLFGSRRTMVHGLWSMVTQPNLTSSGLSFTTVPGFLFG